MSGGDGFSVNTSSLITQAVAWEDQAGQMQLIIRQIDGLEKLGPDGGMFGEFIGPYQLACAHVAMLCGQGQTQMLAIASALIKASGEYQNADHRIALRLPPGEKKEIGHDNRIHGLINAGMRRLT
jgi:hypothetical protein